MLKDVVLFFFAFYLTNHDQKFLLQFHVFIHQVPLSGRNLISYDKTTCLILFKLFDTTFMTWLAVVKLFSYQASSDFNKNKKSKELLSRWEKENW